MTEHAAVGDGAAQICVIGTIVAGIHGPGASLFGIPAERQFEQFVRGGAMKVGPGVVPGPHDEVNLSFQFVRLAALKSDLKLALEVFSVPLNHFEVSVGRGMVIAVPRGVILDAVLRPRARK